MRFYVILYSLIALMKWSKASLLPKHWYESKPHSLFDSVLMYQHKNERQENSKIPTDNSRYFPRQYQHFKLIKFPNTTRVRCNDGSVSGYYIRQSKNVCSKKWLIFLEGGWYCFNNSTCSSRRRTHYDLFSSEFWSDVRQLTGILSNDININPGFYDYNAVYIPYCSSDLWSGKKWSKTNNLYFHGSRILDSVIDDLAKLDDFQQAEEVALVGSSAGGIGVMLNIDRLTRRIKKSIHRKIPVSGIIDSAWFLDYPAYRNSNCTHIYDCPPDTAVRKGMRLWHPRIPRRCLRHQGYGFDWKCFMGPIIYRHLKNPVFIIQSLFDDAQLQMSKVPILEGGSNKKFSYIQQLGGFAAQTLQQATGVFAHSCVDHEILTKNNWATVSVNNQNLGKTLYYWKVFLEDRIIKRRMRRKRANRKKRRLQRVKFGRSKRRSKRKSNNKCKSRKHPRSTNMLRTPSLRQLRVIDSCHITQVTNQQHTSKYQSQTLNNNSISDNPLNRTFTRCSDAIPLIPFCNPTCTPLSHPIFGYKMSFVDLLELYNVRINLIAKSLGITMQNLRQLNTQQQIKLLYCSSK